MRSPATLSARFRLVHEVWILLLFVLGTAAARGGENAWTTGGPAGGAVSSLAVDPSNSAVLFAGTELGIFRSDDGGQTWGTTPAGPPRARTLVFDPSSSATLFAGSPDGLSRSSDGGEHFSLTSFVFPVTALAIDPSNPSTIYAAGLLAPLQKSTDGGGSWTSLLPTAYFVESIASLVLDQAHPGTVLAGSDWDESFYYFPFQGIIKTTDGGAGWSQVFSHPSSPGPQAVTALVADPRSSAVFYGAVSFWQGGYVVRTQDGGATWQSFRLPLRANPSSLVIDPSRPTTLYAGTDKGVFRSADSGASWTRLADGLGNEAISSLVIDATGGSLHAGTAGGVFDIHLQGGSSPEFPCSPGPDHLCLLGGRFQVTLLAQDPRTGRVTSGFPVVQTDGFGYFSLPIFTGDPMLPEILVKMVDASASDWRDFWFFYGGLTDVTYTLNVTDTVAGKTNTYQNDLFQPFCGGADTSGFPGGAGDTPGGTARPGEASILEASGAELSLLDGRFTLTLSATDPRTGRTSQATAIPQGDRFGYFSLPDFTGDASLPEVFVKMIDATSLTGNFWLFYSGLTDLAYTLTVADSTTGLTKAYESPGPFCGGADTSLAASP